MKIEVTQEDINLGLRMSGRFCPVALAMRRAMTDCQWLDVGTGSTMVGTACVTTPDAARKFIHAFDDGKPVEPFTFEFP